MTLSTGNWSPKRWGCSTGPAAIAEAEELAVAALSEVASPQEEAEIRLRLPTLNKHSTQRRVEENRRALQLGDISEVTRARHLGWLAYNLTIHDQRGERRAAADEAAAAAASTGDLEARILADVTLAVLDGGEGYAGRSVRRLEELCALARASDATAARDLAANHYAILLAVVGRLDDAAAQVADGTAQARRERNAMALDMWATIDGVVHLAAGRLSAARAATESLPPPARTGVSEPDMIRIVILAEVAARTDDRNLLQQMVNDARDAYPTGSSVVRRGTAHVLALAAWQRDDVHDAMRWLSGTTLFGSPLWPQVLDQVILGARVASAAGDAGLRARVLQATDLLERERPAIPLLTGVAGYARGILERDAQHWWLQQTCFTRRRGRFFTPRLPRTPALNSRAPTTLTRRSISSMPHSTRTWSTKPSPTRAGSVARCAG